MGVLSYGGGREGEGGGALCQMQLSVLLSISPSLSSSPPPPSTLDPIQSSGAELQPALASQSPLAQRRRQGVALLQRPVREPGGAGEPGAQREGAAQPGGSEGEQRRVFWFYDVI